MEENFSIDDPIHDEPLEVFETVPTMHGYQVKGYNEEKSAIITLTLNPEKQIHSFDDEPAYIRTEIKTNKNSHFVWFENDLEHRIGDYSNIGYFDNGNIAHRGYCQKGKLHRDHNEGFAHEVFCEITGNLTEAEFIENNSRYHPSNAAEFSFDPNSRIVVAEIWFTLPDTNLPN